MVMGFNPYHGIFILDYPQSYLSVFSFLLKRLAINPKPNNVNNEPNNGIDDVSLPVSGLSLIHI